LMIGNAAMLLSLIVLMLVCGVIVVLASANRIWGRPGGDDPQQSPVNLLEPAIVAK